MEVPLLIGDDNFTPEGVMSPGALSPGSPARALEVEAESPGAKVERQDDGAGESPGGAGALQPPPTPDGPAGGAADLEALLPGEPGASKPGRRRAVARGSGCLAASCAGHRARCLHWGLPAVGAALLAMALLAYGLVWAPAGAESLPLDDQAVMRNQVRPPCARSAPAIRDAVMSVLAERMRCGMVHVLAVGTA